MHEMALVRDIVDTVLEEAARVQADHVREVRLTIGKGRDIVFDLFETLFRHLVEGTVAEGAVLDIRETPTMSRCLDCSMIYPVDFRDCRTWRCPRCGSERYAMHSGREFMVDQIDVAWSDGVPAGGGNAHVA